MRIRILDPTAAPPHVDPDPGPPVGPLAGKTVGIRSDRTWPSFEWVIDEWAQALRGARAEVLAWTAGGRVGDAGERTFAQLEKFAGAVDVAIVGLGN